MRKKITTFLLALIATLSVVAAAFLAREGSLARFTGWYHFRPGMYLFPEENRKLLNDVSWMRIQDLHDTIECEREEDGSWWITRPFRDRMSPSAVQNILAFTKQARLVDTLPLNHTTRASLREFGVETSPHTITLKMKSGDGDHTTLARYTLGSTSPWLDDAEDGEHVIATTYLRTDFYGKDKRIHVVRGDILPIFRNGLSGLRDPHPLGFDPDTLRMLTIRKKGEKELVLTRASAESPWSIIAPTLSDADQNVADALVASLAHIKALRVDQQEAVKLPEEPEMTMELKLENGELLQITFYESFVSRADGQLLCYATVNNRPVVFTLPMEPKLRRRSSYSQLVNNVLSLPVLPSSVIARLQSSGDSVYVADMPVTLSGLRSQRLSIELKDVDKVLIRSRYYPYPLKLVRVPGDSDGQTEDVWMFSTEGKGYREADPEVVARFFNGFSNVPVAGFVRDFSPHDDISAAMKEYGLNEPDYTLILQPRECAVRAVLFGVDMPLVKDRSARIFYVKNQRDQEGRRWIGMEQNMFSIYKLSPKLTKLFSFSSLSWRKRNLVSFPIAALRTLTLKYMQATLELNYDYIDSSWTGTLDGKDVTPRINPHRTEYYARHLQKLRVVQWLSEDDEDALRALQQVVFSVKLDLELPDYSELEKVVVKQQEGGVISPDEHVSLSQVADILNEKDANDEAYKIIAEHIGVDDRKTIKRTITIDIAPAGVSKTDDFFYGRIRESGELFILSFDDGLGLDGQLLD